MKEETSPFKVIIIVTITVVITDAIGVGVKVMSAFYPEQTPTFFMVAMIALAISGFIFLYCNEL